MTRLAEERFGKIAQEWQPALRRLCVGYERDEARREDLFQEIMLALWRAMPSFREESSLRTWVFKVAHNVAATHVNRSILEQRSRTAPAEWVQGQAPEGPDETCDERRLADLLADLISGLRPLERQIILLYLEDVPQGEISEITGLTRENVSTRVHRIKEKLTEGMNRRLR